MAMPTLLNIAKANAADAVVGLIEETITANPEVELGAARTISGTQYKTLVRTGRPTVGFRLANEGSAVSTGTYENRLIETFILNPQWECDKAVADGNEDGAEAYIAIEAAGQLEASLAQLAKVFYYGQDATFGDAKGFPGLLAAYDSTNMVVDAGGTTDDTATSVWAVKFGPRDVQWVYGRDGELSSPDVSTARGRVDGSGNPYTIYRSELMAYPGLQVGNIYAIARIKKLTEDSGKGLTDALIATLLSKFPVGRVPDVLLMNRRSVAQLRASRTATNATGAPAAFPEEAFKIPIQQTDSILSTEKLAL